MGSLEEVDVSECEVEGDGMKWLSLLAGWLPRLNFNH